MSKNSFEFKIGKKEGKARTGVLTTPHGEINTPVFMPVGTLATVKSLAPEELNALGADIILSNTYHLYLRPGEDLISKMGGLHKWMNWQKPILTDSGGFQVFSMGKSKLGVKINDKGVEFRSHLDGSKHFLSPEKAIEIQHKLGADIIMAFDECAPVDKEKKYVIEAMKRTHDWLLRCRKEHEKLESKKTTAPAQALFPIIQGGTHEDLRIESAQFICSMDWPGIAIGGLSVGESKQEMYHTIDTIHPHLPEQKPRYLMGVGTPEDLLECVSRGIDMFDCVLPTRMSRHGAFWNELGRQNIRNAQYTADKSPLQKDCQCYSCQNFSKSYIRHLLAEGEILGHRLMTIHNLHFLIDLMREIREQISKGTFLKFKEKFLKNFKPMKG